MDHQGSLIFIYKEKGQDLGEAEEVYLLFEPAGHLESYPSDQKKSYCSF